MKTLDMERLILRDWEIADLDDFFKLMSNPNITVPDGSFPKTTKEVTTILSTCHAEGNTRSEHIIKKLGFKFVKTFYNIKRESDTLPHDVLYYVLHQKSS